MLLLSSCQAEPLYNAQPKAHAPKVKLGKVNCNSAQEACFWFKQHWQGEPEQYYGPEDEVVTLDVTLTQQRNPVLYQEKTDAVRYQYTFSGIFSVHGKSLASPWQERIDVYSYYNTLDSPFVRDMAQNTSIENIIKELQMRWWERWYLKWS